MIAASENGFRVNLSLPLIGAGSGFLPLVCATWLPGLAPTSFLETRHEAEDRMPATDILAPLFGTMLSEPPILPILAELPRPTREQFTSPWTLDTPPLRYGVASLQHWLDLNA